MPQSECAAQPAAARLTRAALVARTVHRPLQRSHRTRHTATSWLERCLPYALQTGRWLTECTPTLFPPAALLPLQAARQYASMQCLAELSLGRPSWLPVAAPHSVATAPNRTNTARHRTQPLPTAITRPTDCYAVRCATPSHANPSVPSVAVDLLLASASRPAVLHRRLSPPVQRAMRRDRH